MTATSHLIRIGGRADTDTVDWPSTGDAMPLLKTGWEPLYSLNEGIQQTTEWWAAQEGITQ